MVLNHLCALDEENDIYILYIMKIISYISGILEYRSSSANLCLRKGGPKDIVSISAKMSVFLFVWLVSLTVS